MQADAIGPVTRRRPALEGWTSDPVISPHCLRLTGTSTRPERQLGSAAQALEIFCRAKTGVATRVALRV